ncbi:AraC family transcriptional regulator [Geminisphaera colitermitum]|uniref:AraC family transcriptional regulator n=1 Tax=Geminisphaera colitermitum TaxID=1148786 RepID=UPI000158D5AF|nr:AraC family transcriptional regulator [Geminisphaera colitermitum]
MDRFFVNLNSVTDGLPGILTIPRPDGLYFGRVIRAKIDYQAPPRPRRPSPYHHMHYHIVLVTGGAGVFDISGELLPTKPGAVFFTSPGQPHQFTNVGRDTTRYTELTFEFVRADGQALDLAFAEMLSTWTKRRCNPVVRHQLLPAQARMLGGGIAALVNRGQAVPRPDDLELGGLAAEILTMLFRTVFQHGGPPPDKIDRARDIIRARYREKICLTALAKEVGLSPAHFSRRFKDRFGRAPIDYQLELRIRSACELLRTSSEPLASVAAAAGFDDVYYFSRLFRQRLGEAPGRFRRAIQVT